MSEDARSTDQDTAIETAFLAGTLPEEDRRTEILIPSGGYEAIVTAPAFDFAAEVAAGFQFSTGQGGWNVTSPTGQHGHGATPEDAVKNIGAVIVPVEREGYAGRLLIRADGSEVEMDS